MGLWVHSVGAPNRQNCSSGVIQSTYDQIYRSASWKA